MAPAVFTAGLPTPEEEHVTFDFPLDHRDSKSESLCAVPDPNSQKRDAPTPTVSRLDIHDYTSEDALLLDIIESMKLSGGCIVRDLISKPILTSLESEIRPHLSKVEQADSQRDDFVPSNTRLVTGLLTKSKTYAVNIVGNRLWKRVNDHFLTSTLKNNWHGNQSRTSISQPQLSTTVTFSVRPGTQAQNLHRDDDIYHTHHPASNTHHLGRDTMLCFFVAGSKTTLANGATRLVPGSHLWDFSVPPPATAPFAAEMDPGDAFFMLGGTYHGAGANTTLDEERLVYAAFATRGYLRQEENQYLANRDLQLLRELPESVLRFAGFGCGKPYLGWVDMEDPMRGVLGFERSSDAEEFW